MSIVQKAPDVRTLDYVEREHIWFRRDLSKQSRETRWRHRRLDADMDLMIESLNT